MKKIIIRILLGIIFLIAQTIWADDVYNFYFQKAPGPTTVIQGGGQGQEMKNAQDSKSQIIDEKDSEKDQGPFDPIEEETTPSKSTIPSKLATSASVADLKSKDNLNSKDKKWRLQIGKATFERLYNSRYLSRSGYDKNNESIYEYSDYIYYSSQENIQLGLQYNFNKYLGIEGILQVDPEGDHQGLVGAIVTPLRISSFGVDVIEFPFSVGLVNFDSDHTRRSKLEYGNFVNEFGLLTYTSMGIKLNLPGSFSATFRTNFSSDGLENNQEHSRSITLAYDF